MHVKLALRNLSSSLFVVSVMLTWSPEVYMHVMWSWLLLSLMSYMLMYQWIWSGYVFWSYLLMYKYKLPIMYNITFLNCISLLVCLVSTVCTYTRIKGMRLMCLLNLWVQNVYACACRLVAYIISVLSRPVATDSYLRNCLRWKCGLMAACCYVLKL